MAGEFRSLTSRVLLVSIAATLGVALFLTGFGAGAARAGGDDPRVRPLGGFSWTYDVETGNPRGPQGQLDFWNYHPQTGEQVANSSPGVAPQDLASLWGTSAK